MFKKIIIISCLFFSQAQAAVDYFDPKKTFNMYEQEIQALVDNAAGTNDIFHTAIKGKIVDQILASCVAFYLDKDYMRTGFAGLSGDKKVRVSTKGYTGKSKVSTRYYPGLSSFRDEAYKFLTKLASPKILANFVNNKEATNKYLALCKEFMLLFKDNSHRDFEGNKDSLMRIEKESSKIGEDIKLVPQENLLYLEAKKIQDDLIRWENADKEAAKLQKPVAELNSSKSESSIFDIFRNRDSLDNPLLIINEPKSPEQEQQETEQALKKMYQQMDADIAEKGDMSPFYRRQQNSVPGEGVYAPLEQQELIKKANQVLANKGFVVEPAVMPSNQLQVTAQPQAPVRSVQEVQKQQPLVAQAPVRVVQEPMRTIVPVPLPVPVRMPVAMTRPALPQTQVSQTPAQKRVAARALALQQKKAKASAVAAAKRKKVQPKRNARVLKRVSKQNMQRSRSGQ